jgi:hypothetical protein
MNTRALLADTRNLAQEQIEQIFEERMTALTAGVEAAVAESLAGARRELAEKLNQAVRGLRSQTVVHWGDVLVTATQGFCDRAALFTREGAVLHLRAARATSEAKPQDVALPSAPAFGSAVESQEPVVAMRTASELSQAIVSWIGEARDRKSHIFPVVVRGSVTALLYADADDRDLDANALELLATVAGAVLESRSVPRETVSDLVNITSGAKEDQDIHLRAQRFARSRIAEIRLFKSEAVKNGRAEHNLYTSLKVEIDTARQVFHRDFLSASESMVDYLHLELVRTLANDDPELLGPEYPGPMV